MTWIVYGACVALVALVLGVISWQALRLERQERHARQETRRQEAMRLALWRMDSRLTPFLVQEAARPYFHYRSFFPADRAYGRMWQPLRAGETLAPSPLLSLGTSKRPEGDEGLILLHFQSEPDGGWSSPQAPRGEMLSLAQAGYRSLTQVARSEELLSDLEDMLGDDLRRDRGDLVAGRQVGGTAASPEAGSADAISDREYRTRQLISEQAQRNVVAGQGGLETEPMPELAAKIKDEAPAERDEAGAPGGRVRAAPAETLTGAGETATRSVFDALISETTETGVRLGSFTPSWINQGTNPELVYAREVRVEGERYVQGFWVDWEALSALLTGSVADLLPNARVEPALEGASASEAAPELLASVPVRLVPGELPELSPSGLSPTSGTLVLSWLALGGAAVAIGFVLRAAIQLSERRGRFVSAVTHELRTPLTTFRLYAQMLADGMVSDEDARREYLATLKSESGRLSGIVENVLEYARLSRRRPGPEQTLEMTPEALLVRLRPTLSRRAEQSGMDLIVSADLEEARRRGVMVTIDPQSVERILMNLVENACKYAGPSDEDEEADPRIHLDVRVQGDRLEFLVADYGPGIPARDRARVFGEFQRGGARPTRSGLGLGLALSRGLAREGGGDLRLVRRRGHGAEFLLSLPVHAPAHGGASVSHTGA